MSYVTRRVISWLKVLWTLEKLLKNLIVGWPIDRYERVWSDSPSASIGSSVRIEVERDGGIVPNEERRLMGEDM
jgi:hypothetical protein